MLKIGILTSWNTQCGIAEYSRHLVNAFHRRADVEVTVLGSRNYGDRKIAEHESYVRPSFAVPAWNNGVDHSLDVEQILALDLDVLHVQYEVVFYEPQKFQELLSRFTGIKVITYHDNCFPEAFDFNLCHAAIVHRDTIGKGPRYVMPFGIEDVPPMVKTFGLGRSRADIIGKICAQQGWQFEHSFGERTWKTSDELTSWLRDSDAIVLYYDEAPAAGSSQAARTAIATRRPVIVNNTTWFKDVEGVHAVVESPRELEQTLCELLINPIITDSSWDNLAAATLDIYKECR